MRIPRHTKRIGCLTMLILGVGVFVWIAFDVAPLMRYNQRSQRINIKICSLEKRRPANISADFWQECIAWASIAHCNIYFSEEHATYSAMCRFEEQLDGKLKGDIDLNTIAWIGDRLAETGPHGQQYMTKWRKQWEAMLHEAKHKEQSRAK